MKDAARLLGYFAATVFFGALLAPLLFWKVQWLATHGFFPNLAHYRFEAFFHRAVMLGAIVFFWPLLRGLRIKNRSDLGLAPNLHWRRDAGIGLLISAVPLLCCGIFLLALNVYGLRASVHWPAIGQVLLAGLFVAPIEEALFRGLFLGVLLRSNRPLIATLASAGIFSIVHFLKAPNETNIVVTWASGFNSIAHSFAQFTEPMLMLAGFATLFLLGCILADARLRTRSLWLPIGLHAGWIFVSGAFNKIAHQQMLALPWLGKNLTIGLLPLCVGLISWALLRIWFSHVGSRAH
ncbi:MAG: CPBP family intramembrane glutamic endopeptidase [Verrucomicrobiota bacterium]